MPQNLKHQIIASSIGTALEWFDFALFTYLTPLLAQKFFPVAHVQALLLTYGIFAVGYFMRPLGAILFGHLGDRYGRKKSLVLSIVLMSVPTFCMGLLPTYETIGIAAPILLICLRLIQGFSVGGESTGGLLFILENISLKKLGFLGGLLWGVVGFGMFLGSLAATIVMALPTISWAWRVPFLFGLVTGVIGFFLRKHSQESILFLAAETKGQLKKFPLKSGILQFPREFLILVSYYILSAMITYLIFVFMPTYASQVVGMPARMTNLINTGIYFLDILLVIFFGFLSDKVGRQKCLYVSIIALTVLSYPLFILIGKGNILLFILCQIIFTIFSALFQGTLTAATFVMLQTSVRYSLLAVSYNVSYALFGGTAPFIAMFLVKMTGIKAAPGLYLTFGALLALIAILNCKKPERDPAFNSAEMLQ